LQNEVAVVGRRQRRGADRRQAGGCGAMEAEVHEHR